MKLIQSGPRTAKVMLVGEAPGTDEVAAGRPFVGASGYELNRQLAASGFNRDELFITNVCHERPPGNDIEQFFGKRGFAVEFIGRYPNKYVVEGINQLFKDIDEIKPNLIIAMGNTPLWALAGVTGIMRWRGSVLRYFNVQHVTSVKMLCTLHPTFVLREQVLRSIVIADLKRAKRESEFSELNQPQWNFFVPAKVDHIKQWFANHTMKPLVCDIENHIGSGVITCIGFASGVNAICIPFERGNHSDFWKREEETEIINLLQMELRSHPIIMHNGLHDCQVIAKQWGVMSNLVHDTMVMQHVAFPGMLGGKIDPLSGRVSKKGSSLSLAFCASMYCDNYVFWKEDGKDRNGSVGSDGDYWMYNCTDTVRTYEVWEKLTEILQRDKLWEQYQFEMRLFKPVFKMMFGGVRFDDRRRRAMQRDVDRQIEEIQSWLNRAIGHPLNTGSTPAMMDFFYNDLQCQRILHRKTKRPTLDDKALERIGKQNPILLPIIERIQAIRSLRVLRSNFLDVRLRPADGRLCGAFNIAGVETMRFSSNVNAFGEGMNLQNLPRPQED